MLTPPIRKLLESTVNSSSRELGTGKNRFSITNELQIIQATSRMFFYTAISMCILIFVLTGYLMLANQNNTEYLIAIYSIGGTSLTGLIFIIVKLTKSYIESSLILILVSKLPIDDVLPVLHTLLKNHQLTDTKSDKSSDTTS